MRHKTVIAQTVSESQIVTQKNYRVNSIADDLLSQSRLYFGLKQTILPKRTILKNFFFDSKQTVLFLIFFINQSRYFIVFDVGFLLTSLFTIILTQVMAECPRTPQAQAGLNAALSWRLQPGVLRWENRVRPRTRFFFSARTQFADKAANLRF